MPTLNVEFLPLHTIGALPQQWVVQNKAVPAVLPPIQSMTNSTNPAPNSRKDSFVPLRLGPVGRARTLIDSLAPPSNYVIKDARPHATPIASAETVKYPRIIVRDLQGRSLDTFTTLQEAIYRASWNRKTRGEYPKTALEWRLPKAPVPSKPDFTRAGPVRAMTAVQLESSNMSRRVMRSYSPSVTSANYGKAKRIDLTTDLLVDVPVLEIPVDDVSYVAQSLQHLPNLPSFTFLRHSLLAGQSTYVQIVASILLHQRLLKGTDSRTSEWDFPGFCRGCKRAGFCYGCSKNPKPHIHEDVPARTGGGFRFWKPDRPRNPHAWKNPSNWKLPSTESELQDIIKKYGGLAAYEKAIIAARREMMTSQYEVLTELASQGKLSDGKKLERITTLGSYPPQVTIVSTDQGLETDDDEEEDLEEDSLVDAYSFMTEQGREEASREARRRLNTREESWRGKRDRSRSEDTSMSRRGRRIGVTSYKEDMTSTTSRSSRNLSHVSGGSVRIDTGLGDEWTEDGNDKEEDDEVGEERTKDEGVERDVNEDGKIRNRKGQKVSIVEPPGAADDEARGRRPSRLSKSSRSQSHSVGRLSATNRSDSTVSRSSWMRSKSAAKEEKDSEESKKRKERTEEPGEDEDALETIPFARKRKEFLYKAPKFFTVQKKNRKLLVGQDPFSSDRQLNVPKGPGFQLKKSDRKEIKFVEIKRNDANWTAPKAFEVKKADKKAIKFWAPKRNKSDDADKNKRRGKSLSTDRSPQRRGAHSSPDSGLQSATEKENLDPTPEPTVVEATEEKDNTDNDANQGQDKAADGMDGNENKEPPKPKRREIVKKSRVERAPPPTPPKSPPRLRSPPPFQGRRSPTPSPPPPPASPTPRPEIHLPEIDAPEIPDLPEIKDKEADPRKQRGKFLIQPAPTLQDAPKKRRAPPRVRILPKHLSRHRRTKAAEAPVSQEDLMDINDPLDFLAKYCIINPDRLPFYEIIFESTVAEQDPRYKKAEEKKEEEEKEEEGTEGEGDVEKKAKKKGKSKKKKAKSADPMSTQINPDLIPATRGLSPEKSTLTVEEQHLEKIIYTLDLLYDKLTSLGMELEDMENRRTKILADRAREIFPEVTAPDYFPKSKKKNKKGKKSKSPAEQPRRLRPDEITDEIIVARLDDKMLQALSKDPELRQLGTEMDRAKDKISDIQRRVEEMASERLLADAFCMNHFFLRQGLDKQEKNGNGKAEFKRQQSELYNRLNPSPNFEMNVEEVEIALQQINNHLLTEKEVFFLYSILNLPRREKINFRLFSIVAALSEKVTQLDPVIKKLINNFNYNALDVKMDKCKELFELLEADDMPKGGAMASSLAVELNAGGLRPEHTRHVLHKFNRENKGVVDFLDFVTYVPLFVEIHKRIIQDPLRVDQDL